MFSGRTFTHMSTKKSFKAHVVWFFLDKTLKMMKTFVKMGVKETLWMFLSSCSDLWP